MYVCSICTRLYLLHTLCFPDISFNLAFSDGRCQTNHNGLNYFLLLHNQTIKNHWNLIQVKFRYSEKVPKNWSILYYNLTLLSKYCQKKSGSWAKFLWAFQTIWTLTTDYFWQHRHIIFLIKPKLDTTDVADFPFLLPIVTETILFKISH